MPVVQRQASVRAAPIAEISLAEWRRVMAVNLDGAFLTLVSSLRAMGATGWQRGGGRFCHRPRV